MQCDCKDASYCQKPDVDCRYQELVYERYAAPKEEVILGSFLVAVPRPLQRSAEKKKIETKKRATKTKSSKQKDIRQMLSATKQKGSITMEDKIVIDNLEKIMIFLKKIIVFNQLF